MSKLVWKYFLEQKINEIKDWLSWDGKEMATVLAILPFALCGIIAFMFGTGYLLLLPFPSLIEMFVDGETFFEVRLCLGLIFWLLLGLLVFVGYCIYKPIAWIRSNWKEAKQRANA